MKSYSQPIVPSLYFETHRSISISDAQRTESDKFPSPELPCELLSHCLASYANWGDLAKLACVQKSWSNVVMDTANQSLSSQWELATALFEGDCGLVKCPERAVRILKALAHVTIEIDESTGKPLTTLTTLTTPEAVPVTISDNAKITNNNDNNNTNEDLKYQIFAMKKIAKCYLEGEGVSTDSNLAVAWMEAAFLVGKDAESAHDLAVMYEYGHHGIEVDVVAAAEWFERGAAEGNVESMVELGLCYELGCGVEQSDELALDWYTKAAHLGHPTAKFSVGEIFEEARGVPQSDEEACLWYYRAALVGCDDSKLALRRLYDIARIVVPGVTTILSV
eukprot:jgi/Psemu1/318278/estExt_fgenesh1_pm.C_630008